MEFFVYIIIGTIRKVEIIKVINCASFNLIIIKTKTITFNQKT